MGISIDNKLCFEDHYRDWLNKHSGNLNDYLNMCVELEDHDHIRGLFNSIPFIGKVVLEDYLTNMDDIEAVPRRVINYLMTEGHELSDISGSKGGGKTALGVWMIEEMAKTDPSVRKVYIGAPNVELEKHGWETIPNVKSMKKDDAGQHDEMAIFMASRSSMSAYNVEFIEALATIRHKEIKHLTVMTQSTKRMDVAILEYVSAHFIKSYSDAFSLDVERGLIKDDLIYEFLVPRANYIIPSKKKEWSFVKTGDFMNLMYTPIVPWYSDKVGKAFGLFENEKEAMKWAYIMVKDDYDLKYVRKFMNNKGFNRNLEWWNEFKNYVLDGKAGLSEKEEKEATTEVHDVKKLIEPDGEDMTERRKIAIDNLKRVKAK